MLYEKIKLEGDEKILTEVRKHWFVLFVRILAIVILAIIPLALYFVLVAVAGAEVAATLDGRGTLLLYFYVAWLFLMWMALFNTWTDWYLDTWTVTNKRLISVDQKGLFSRSTGSFRLERLQDMNVDIHGIIATLLDFGTLQAQTAAGHEDEFRADGLPSPRELKALILKAADDSMAGYRTPGGADGV